MKWIIRLLVAGMVAAVLGCCTVAGIYFYLAPQLPSIEKIRDIHFQVPLRIYTRDGALIQEFGEKRRTPIAYEKLPKALVQAFVAAEDDSYFSHHGVDYKGLLAAVFELVTTGKRSRGGSTITMQVARNLFLSLEKSYERKLKEIILSFRIENELSKQEIMELYLNKIFMGHRAYGVGAAAEVYYGKSVDALNLAEIAMIAGLPKAPSAYNPITNPTRALERRDYVLGRMKSLGFITPEAYETAMATGVTARIHHSMIEVISPYVGELVRAQIVARFGEEEAFSGGYSVTTTIDSRLQPAADRAVRRALHEYDRRHGYRGAERKIELSPSVTTALPPDIRPISSLTPAIVVAVEERAFTAQFADGSQAQVEWEGMRWARPFIHRNGRGPTPKTASAIVAVGDVVRLLPAARTPEETETTAEVQESAVAWELAQLPEAEGALVALDSQNGAIRALVGGYNYYSSKFNRATQAKRQPGSGFKAIIYSGALEYGYHPASLINDAPVVFDDVSLEGEWRPENYSGKFFGPTRLRVALIKSRNLVSIRLLRSIGIDYALTHAARFGFDPAELPQNLSLSLGSAVVSPLQMSTAYAVLANGGYRVAPHLIERIDDVNGDPVYQAAPLTVCAECRVDLNVGPPHTPIAPRVISEENHYLMNSMMRDVIRAGTATKAKSLGRSDLAGKTGTTNDQRDAWFNGFHPDLVANVWVGFDDNAKLGRGEVGGRAALPAWIYFMETALETLPQRPLSMPSGVVQVLIDPRTGKRAYSGQPDAVFEVFPKDSAPQEQSNRREFEFQHVDGPQPEGEGEERPDSPAVPPPTTLDLF